MTDINTRFHLTVFMLSRDRTIPTLGNNNGGKKHVLLYFKFWPLFPFDWNKTWVEALTN